MLYDMMTMMTMLNREKMNWWDAISLICLCASAFTLLDKSRPRRPKIYMSALFFTSFITTIYLEDVIYDEGRKYNDDGVVFE